MSSCLLPKGLVSGCSKERERGGGRLYSLDGIAFVAHLSHDRLLPHLWFFLRVYFAKTQRGCLPYAQTRPAISGTVSVVSPRAPFPKAYSSALSDTPGHAVLDCISIVSSV